MQDTVYKLLLIKQETVFSYNVLFGEFGGNWLFERAS